MKRSHTLFWAATVAFGAIASACAPVNILNRITPSGSFEKTKNISYGALERQTLDLYKTDRPKAGAPMLVFIHGGSWSEGHKDIYKFLAEGFTSSGYDIAVPNYRLFPEARYPDMIVDSAKAVAFIAKQNPDRPLVLLGHSAGAYNMLMTILVPQYLESEGIKMCERIAGAVSLAGPTGIVPLKEEPYITIFPDRFTKTDAPLNQVGGPTPPIFFGHGAKDTTVYPQNSERLAEQIKARGGIETVKIYKDLNHTDVVRVISRHFEGGSELKADIVNFIDTLPPLKDNFCQ